MIKEQIYDPDLGIIEEKGKELGLGEGTITKAKNFAIQYFKKTDKISKYPKMLMPAFLYIACHTDDSKERRTQVQIGNVFNISPVTIRKWYIQIINELHIQIKSKQMLEYI